MILSNLTKIYSKNNENVKALDNISLEFSKVGCYFILGKSGSGKTTLLHLIGGLIEPTSGLIIRDHINNEQKLSQEVGIVFQDYNLFEHMSVYENLMIQLKINGFSKVENESIIKSTLAKFGMDDFIHRVVRNLSGGEKQRIAIIRGILHQPNILLVDEPTGNLDAENALLVNQLIKEISKQILVIYVTHDIKTAHDYGTDIITLSSGKLESVTKLELYEGNIVNYKIGKRITDKSFVRRRFMLRFLNLHKLRLIFTIIPFLISTLLFCIVFSLWQYQSARVQSKYIDTYEIKQYTLYEERSYFNIFNTEYQQTIKKGEMFHQKIDSLFDDNQTYVRLNHQVLQLVNEQVQMDFYKDVTKLNELLDLDLMVPLNLNEIIISDYLALKNQITVGMSLSYQGITLTVVGIFDTDFESNNYIAKKQFGNLDLFDYDKEKNDYLKVVSSFETYLNIYDLKNSINVPGLYLSDQMTLMNQLNSRQELFKLDENDSILYGRLPLLSNEVVINESYAIELGILSGNVFTSKNYDLINYKDHTYNETYQSYLNLFDYLGNKVEVVGVNNQIGHGLYVIDEIYDLVKSNFNNHYAYDELGLVKLNLLSESDINNLEQQGIRIDEPGINLIDQFASFMSVYEFIVVVLISLLLIITVFMISSLFMNIFITAKKDIGILLSLGLSKTDIQKIFLGNALVISLITLVTLIITYLVSVLGINEYAKMMFTLRYIEIYLFDNVSFMVSGLMIFVVSLLSSLSIVYKIRKQNSIELIKID